MFTYFVISPGFDEKSFVRYPTGESGSYIKFGEDSTIHTVAGIRDAYRTHNPDIGVGAIMDSTIFSAPYLGTRLKNCIIDRCKIKPVGGTKEWFSVITSAGWALFNDMQQFDDKTLTLSDQGQLEYLIETRLT